MDSPNSILNSIWSAVLTVAGGLILMFVKRTADALKQKVDRDELMSFRHELRDWKESQERQHAENRKRLDEILLSLGIRRKGDL